MTTKTESAANFKDLTERAAEIQKRTKDIKAKFDLATTGLAARLTNVRLPQTFGTANVYV